MKKVTSLTVNTRWDILFVSQILVFFTND